MPSGAVTDPTHGRVCCRPSDAGSQVSVRRQELGPSGLGVAALPAGEVGGEILDMDLDPAP